jgi:4-hydroxy-tetrahydrodipicolinate reductase
MRIALVGYGKMGKAIEKLALDRGHEIVLKIDENNLDAFTADALKKANVAIEFTGPHSAFENAKKIVSSGVPLVSGSTGWLDKLKEVKQLCLDNKVSFIYASNYSVGVNIFFDINKRLASLMASHPQYNVQVKETHHTEKKDAPSGTAITIAEDILQQLPSKNNWVNRESQKMDELSIISERVDPAPGTHAVTYSSPVDDITIIHTAHNREGFALGAVLAAEYIHDKKGIFSMRDVLNL